MTGGHWAVLVAVLTGIGLQLSGLEHWGDATNPKFLAGLLLNITGAIGGLFTKQAARDPNSQDRRRDGDN